MPITYTDKDNTQPTSDPRRIFTAGNANEVKSVVNSIETAVSSLTTTVSGKLTKTSIKRNIIPTGAVNGSNLIYTLPDSNPDNLCVYVDTSRLTPTVGFTVSGVTLTIIGIAPVSAILCDYEI